MNILDTRIREIDFTPKENAHFHMNPFAIKTVLQRMISKIKVRQRDDYSRASEDRANDIVLPEHRMWPFNREDFFWYRLAVHAFRWQCAPPLANVLLSTGMARDCSKVKRYRTAAHSSLSKINLAHPIGRLFFSTMAVDSLARHSAELFAKCFGRRPRWIS